MRIVVVAALIAGCGAPPIVARAPTPTANRWATLGFEDRHSIMTFTVLPNMSRTFQREEHTDAPRLACITCHGANAEEIDYRMPNGLPPLDPAHLPDSRQGIARFMTEVVTPLADRLMQAGGTTTCFSCHPRGGDHGA